MSFLYYSRSFYLSFFNILTIPCFFPLLFTLISFIFLQYSYNPLFLSFIIHANFIYLSSIFLQSLVSFLYYSRLFHLSFFNILTTPCVFPSLLSLISFIFPSKKNRFLKKKKKRKEENPLRYNKIFINLICKIRS